MKVSNFKNTKEKTTKMQMKLTDIISQLRVFIPLYILIVNCKYQDNWLNITAILIAGWATHVNLMEYYVQYNRTIIISESLTKNAWFRIF